MTSSRLPPQPGEVIDRSTQLSFRWNGRNVSGFEGDTIVSALAAAGVQVFSRSFKTHRPRGILTADANDPNCLLQVDGEPNVRAAHRLLRSGMNVRTQNVWPSLRMDVKRLAGLVSPFTGPGFYYKTFMSPAVLRPVYRRALSRMSPGGLVTRPGDSPTYDKRYAFADVVVAGGGPAGLQAAIAAADAGASVLLAEADHQLGGHWRYGDTSAREALRELMRRVLDHDSIEVLTDAVVLGRYDGNRVAVLHRSPGGGALERIVKARPRALIVATGAQEQPVMFNGNDLPGVMLGTAARRLINLFGVKPGERAVVWAATVEGREIAADLERAHVEVTLLDPAMEQLRGARGRGRVQEVLADHGRRISSDLLVISGGWCPQPLSAGIPSGPDGDDVFLTAGVVGEGSTEALLEHASATGALAARHGSGSGPRVTAIATLQPQDRAPETDRFLGGIVDYAEEVSVDEVIAAAAEGYDSAELAKRFTTATMGNDQGRLSSANLGRVLARATGKAPALVGSTTVRPPATPVSLGALAARRVAHDRVSPIHSWHVAHGARFVRTGDWLRPDSYGDPLGEVRAVRSAVGVMDVSALGKVDLRGPDVVRLLDLVYVNRWGSLQVGRVRYGLMVTEDGVALDDGVTARIGDERYLMSTTSSGSERVRRWLEYWLQVEHPDWRIALTPATEAFAAMNVAGPRARDLLRRLTTEVDLDPDAFPYMSVRGATIAGVPECFMWRIGFTGELSYELYVPAGYGLHVWETLFENGGDLGLRPFGVEAQRTMRIEKGHAVIGQDSDTLTGPYALGLGRLVATDKPDAVARQALDWQREHADSLPFVLVGLQTVDRTIVPPDFSQLMLEGQIVGRVTSARFSPALDRSVALALITPAHAEAGTTVEVRLPDGVAAAATIQVGTVHFDPAGDRLRV